MTEEEILDNKVNEMLFNAAFKDYLISDWEFRNIDRDAIKAVFRNIGSSHKEERRLWKIHNYGILEYNKHFEYKDYFSDIKELTESEAVKWYNNYNPLFLRKGSLFYKKEGEWIVYETK